MLWEEIKLATLKKIDPSITSLTPSRNSSDYLNAIIPAANRGLQDLSTAGKFINKRIVITQNPIQNLLPQSMMNQFRHLSAAVPYLASRARAYYFEVNGKAEVDILVGDNLVKTITNDSKGVFVPYKDFIPNPQDKDVSIVFRGQYPYLYRNIALYDVNFETADDIWEYVSEKRYDMRELTPDFYKLVTTDLVFQSGIDDTRYSKTENYYWEGDSVLVLDGLQKGEWIVHYYSYPKKITLETKNDEDIGLDPEVASLLPVFMAAELFEDENVSTAQYWREQYESMKAQLTPSQNYGQRAIFVDSNGW